MKKLLILFLISCNLCKANHNYILKDTTVIHQISFSRGGNPGYDYNEPIFKSNQEIKTNKIH